MPRPSDRESNPKTPTTGAGPRVCAEAIGYILRVGSASALIELGDRYWALGLPAAAKSALTRALGQSEDAIPALRLTDMALALGDVAGARGYAAEAARRAPGPA